MNGSKPQCRSNIRIVASLIRQCAGRTMTREKFGFSRQAHHFADRFHELTFIGIGKISSPHRATDNEIAADEYTFFGKVKHDMARCMTRRMNDFNLQTSDHQFLTVINDFIRLARRNDKRKRKHRGFRVAKLGNVETVHKDFGIGKGFDDFSVIGDMIEMTMSQPQTDELITSPPGFFQKRFDSMVGSIKKHSLTGFVVGDQVTVGGSQATVVGQDLHNVS